MIDRVSGVRRLKHDSMLGFSYNGFRSGGVVIISGWEYGIFAYGIGQPAAPIPVRARHLYLIGDTGYPDWWSLIDQKNGHELTITTVTADAGLYLIPFAVGQDLRAQFRSSVMAKGLPRSSADALEAQWAQQSPPLMAVYETFLKQFDLHSTLTRDTPYFAYCHVLGDRPAF